MSEPVFTITNVAMHPQTKVRRFYQPGRVRQKQFLAGRRMLHNDCMRLSPEEFDKHMTTILDRVRMGAFQVTTPDGETVFCDQHGVLKIRRGQEIHDLPLQPTKSTPSEVPVKDEIEKQLEEMVTMPGVVTDDMEIPAEDIKSVGVTQAPGAQELDFSTAFQAEPEEPKSETEKARVVEHSKKGKRR
jgi:hypothetical protein